MNTPLKNLIANRCTSFVCLITLSSFTLTSAADQGVVVLHKEMETACLETTMTKQMYNMIPDVADIYSKGACTLVSSRGEKVFGGCKHLSGDGIDWYYDMPAFYSDSNFKAEIKKSCAEWVSVGTK